MHAKDDALPGPLTKVYYRPIEAAIRWSGLHRHEASILNLLGKRQMPTRQEFPQWPTLRLNVERIYDAILHSELPFGRHGVHAGSSYNTECMEYLLHLFDLTVRHIDLRRWMLRCYPGQRPRFLFTAAERAAHPTITAQAGQALLVEQAALKALVRQCKQQVNALQLEYGSARASRVNASAPSSPARSAAPTEATLSRRAETTYLNIIGALLCLLLGDAPSGKPYSAFRTQEAIISALIAHHDGLMGLTERTLQAKFAQAKRQVASQQPLPYARP
ncbi:hypothetical protein ACQR5S_20060 [Xanthomonas oryzae pv. oryzicola]|uniref:hypothetical protein n=1 Tax=Xanthomonas oryzae TaxID=347 RepID=UPI000B40DA3A|nr:hypothetical protein [Xanthomonas oryzae]OWB28833.1 hypothetical protein XocBAI20_12165 [Xanthomonas oryzae pv. oryzicola]QBH01342.1 hypothetical protein EYC56_21345 [Xanthomonas oryzae]